MPLILHGHPLSSYCWKVLIALYEREIGFEFRHLDLADPDAASRFRSLWPIGKMPVLEDEGKAIAESTIIIEHLDLRHPGPPPMLPSHAAGALEARRLDRLFDAYVMGPIQKIVGDRLRNADARDRPGVEEARRLLITACDWLDGELAGRRWTAGETFGLADCAAAPALFYANEIEPLRAGSTLAALLERLKARPSVARVLKEADPWLHLFPREAA